MDQHLCLVIHVCLNFDLISVSTPNFADLLLIITHNGNQSKMRGWTDWHAERGCTARSHPEHRISIASGRSHHRQQTTIPSMPCLRPKSTEREREGDGFGIKALWDYSLFILVQLKLKKQNSTIENNICWKNDHLQVFLHQMRWQNYH